MIFLDASAIIKAYLTEIGSAEVRMSIETLRGGLCLTPHVVLEVLSAFAKMLRTNQMDRRLYRSARIAFIDDLASLHVFDVERAVFQLANRLVDSHRRVGVSAMDVLHVASALDLQAAWPNDTVIVASSDHAFLALARATGLRTFDPETESFGELRARLDSSLRS
jgi:predicted nucleic acid-binding protein